MTTPTSLQHRHRRVLLMAATGLVLIQAALLAWLWLQPMPDRLARPGQGESEPLSSF